MSDTKKVKSRCPECGSDLVIDVATGEVLHVKPIKKPLAGGHDFDSLFEELDKSKERAEELFERERAAHDDRERLLEEKFKEALKRAEESDEDEPPPSPFDFD